MENDDQNVTHYYIEYKFKTGKFMSLIERFQFYISQCLVKVIGGVQDRTHPHAFKATKKSTKAIFHGF